MSSRSSKSDRSAALPEHITVGRIRKPHGVRGEVSVEVLSDVDGRITAGSVIDVVMASGDRRSVLVSSVRGRVSGAMIVQFEGTESRDQAEMLRSATLEVDLAKVPEAPEGMFYYFEMVGCLCVDQSEGELGTVADIVEDGGGLLLEIVRGSKNLLVPFVEA